MIKAITFDLWDTVIHDESDEAKRVAKGLRSKPEERRHLVWEALDRVEPVPQERVVMAYDVVESAFNYVWKHNYITWTARERIEVLLRGMKRDVSAAALDAIVRAHETMEVEVPPDPIEGAARVLPELAQKYPLAVVSDAINTPGSGLRQWLKIYDLEKNFRAFAFSDEVGRSKPHRDIFARAARALGVNFSEMVHIGDRDHNDVKGAQALGMKAILFTATRDKDADHTTADAICRSYTELPGVIAKLAKC